MRPDRKWFTDITEFSIPASKVYLSAVINCYDGEAVSWNMSVNPDAALANKTLDMATLRLKSGASLILYLLISFP